MKRSEYKARPFASTALPSRSNSMRSFAVTSSGASERDMMKRLAARLCRALTWPKPSMVLESQLPLVKTFLDDDRQLDQLERFCEVVVGALLHRAHCRFYGSETGHDDCDDFRISHERFLQQLDACLTRQVVICDQHVVRGLRQLLDRLFGRCGLVDFKTIHGQNI